MIFDVSQMLSPLVEDDHDAAAGSPTPAQMSGMAALTKATSMEIAQRCDSSSSAKEITTEEQVQPYPFFYYRDHSRDEDQDPLYPLVPPGRVPNFPAKMHAILSRSDLEDIVAWMPHGRSWRVLKPRDFETKVIPQYFEHTKYSSFIRQANGWGFKRITQGMCQGSYYHPRFLRGLPHLCKRMKRQVKSSSKKAKGASQEPDLFKISAVHPVPEQAPDDSIMLSCTMKGGPKARMPIYVGAVPTFHNHDATTANSAMELSLQVDQKITKIDAPVALAPKQEAEPSSTPAFTAVYGNVFAPVPQVASSPPASPPMQPNQTPDATKVDCASCPFTMAAMFPSSAMFPQATLLQVAHPFPFHPGMAMMAAAQAPAPSSDGGASFAAGFAAATAFSQQHFNSLLQSISVAPEGTKN